MADDKTKQHPQDNARVNVHEPCEVKYWTQSCGATRAGPEASVIEASVPTAAVTRQLGEEASR